MNEEQHLQKHISPLGAWAFSIGTSVGWGSLVVTASTYLAQAGPVGSVLGLLLGTAAMLIICRNYTYLMHCYPEAGGAYAFTREIFGYDYGFMTAWFLAMTYFAVLWANATSLPLFGRIFLGGVFRIGRLYTIFGYDVYLGEALLSIAALILIAFLVSAHKKLVNGIMIALALTFAIGIALCFFAAIFNRNASMAPSFIPDSSAVGQIVKIAVISPWAFIGFESISHATEEFNFDHKKIHRILLIAVISTFALYAMVTLLSVTAYPPQYGSWIEYIRDLDHLEGIEALPAFYAASHYLGGFGVTALMLSLLALVITSLIGNMMALSRLCYSLGKDRILPESFAKLSDRGIPKRALFLVAGISCLIPFIGRTAIGWIVDVTTIGAVLIYGLVSASAAKMGKSMEDRREMWTGRIGLALMLFLGAYFLLPSLISKSTLATETYFLFIIWSVLGFLFFRSILHRDAEKRFGRSIIVWVALLSFVLFVALVWMRQSMITSNSRTTANIEAYYRQDSDPSGQRREDEQYIQEQLGKLSADDTRTMLMAVGMFAFALIIMMTNHSYMHKRTRESEKLANTDPMTGVKNKHAYLTKEVEMNAALNEGRSRDFAIVVCDVNGLKRINDTYGHKAGDEYIRSACFLVCEIFSHSPVYRVGGDEFAVILEGRDYDIRHELMSTLHDRSVEHIRSDGAVVSGGLSDYQPESDTKVHDVFERADTEMYEEKRRLKSLGAATRDDEEEQLPASLDVVPSLAQMKRRVLIVEDEEINQMILANILEEDYELLFASDGMEALSEIWTNKDDLALVLLDLMLPRMSGLEVLRNMKEETELQNIPVIIVTADQHAEVECLKLGAVDFIPKPYPSWEIIQVRVNKAIELSENRGIIQSTERDHLTKLLNLDFFYQYVKMHDHHYLDMSMDAIVVDISHFHMINERYGRQYGDSVLRRLGERVRHLARRIDGLGCRRGSDTFYLYCPHRDNYGELLDRLSTGLTDDASSSDRVRLRLGVYADVDKSMDIERRFDRAKAAADSVKSGYAKPVGIYTPKMHETALYNERLIEDFHSSIEQGRFLVYYQPKFNIRPEEPILASAEALVRWDHPELGMISPSVFIPLLEENGLILDLDKFVWRSAAARIREWKDKYGFAVPVSVNISRIDMLMPDLKDVFREILDTYALSTEDIILEITESAYTGDSEQVLSTARELRGMGMGFRIEMDDFGTGYSSLGMLAHLPIDALKLDMTFVKNAFSDTRDTRMIELIIDIAAYLHVPVVAEGVETEEQYQVLKAMDCDLVQGFYFSRPVPGEEFEKFLIERGRCSIEVTDSVRKTYMSLSKAISSDFEHVYYIDTLTDYYLEFRLDKNGDLQILPGGKSFFREAGEKLLEDAVPDSREKLTKALKKENLIGLTEQGEDSTIVSYRRLVGGEEKHYCLQTIRSRSSDDHHIVIGVRPRPSA